MHIMTVLLHWQSCHMGADTDSSDVFLLQRVEHGYGTRRYREPCLGTSKAVGTGFDVVVNSEKVRRTLGMDTHCVTVVQMTSSASSAKGTYTNERGMLTRCLTTSVAGISFRSAIRPTRTHSKRCA